MADTSLKQAVGSVLKHRRRARRLTQEELADACGLHSTYISQLERGLKAPTISTLFRLAEALGVRPSRLVLAVEAELEG